TAALDKPQLPETQRGRKIMKLRNPSLSERLPVPALGALAALTTSILIALALAGCGSQAAETAGPPPAEVSVASVVSKTVRPWDEFTGRISAVESVDLRPRVSGYIERVAYAEGQEVR